VHRHRDDRQSLDSLAADVSEPCVRALGSRRRHRLGRGPGSVQGSIQQQAAGIKIRNTGPAPAGAGHSSVNERPVQGVAMGPEMSQFLSGMKKTREQVVLPNLTDRFAQEQAGIVAATLGFLEQIHDKVFHYELLENHLYRNLLSEVIVVLYGATPPQHEVAVT